MQYRKLGQTGLEISNLSFGASSLGSVFHETKETECIKAVETAIEGGINLIDVSPYYGHYKAETVLGKALKLIPRNKYVLSTKVGRYGKDGVNTWDYSAKRAIESVYESMERLNVDYIDIRGSRNAMPQDFRAVIHYLERATCPLDKLVSRVVSPDEALETMRWWDKNPGKVFRILVKW